MLVLEYYLSALTILNWKERKIWMYTKPHLLFSHGTGSSNFRLIFGLERFPRLEEYRLGYPKIQSLAFQHRDTYLPVHLENVHRNLSKSLQKILRWIWSVTPEGGLVADTLARFCVPGSKSKGLMKYERSVLEQKEASKGSWINQSYLRKRLIQKNIPSIERWCAVALSCRIVPRLHSQITSFSMFFNLIGI